MIPTLSVVKWVCLYAIGFCVVCLIFTVLWHTKLIMKKNPNATTLNSELTSFVEYILFYMRLQFVFFFFFWFMMLFVILRKCLLTPINYAKHWLFKGIKIHNIKTSDTIHGSYLQNIQIDRNGKEQKLGVISYKHILKITQVMKIQINSKTTKETKKGKKNSIGLLYLNHRFH